MRPHQLGGFPFPISYGYRSTGILDEGPAEWIGKRVFGLFPHFSHHMVTRPIFTPSPQTFTTTGRCLRGQSKPGSTSCGKSPHESKIVASQVSQGPVGHRARRTTAERLQATLDALHGATLTVDATFTREELDEHSVVLDVGHALRLLDDALTPLRYANLVTHPGFSRQLLTITAGGIRSFFSTDQQSLGTAVTMMPGAYPVVASAADSLRSLLNSCPEHRRPGIYSLPAVRYSMSSKTTISMPSPRHCAATLGAAYFSSPSTVCGESALQIDTMPCLLTPSEGISNVGENWAPRRQQH